MTERSQPKIRAATQKGRSWTKITFYPDLEKFQMTYLEEDIVAVMQKRTMDMAGLFGKSLKVSFNGKHIKLDSFEDYVDLYLKKESEVVVPRIGCKPNERWEVIVAPSDTEFVQVRIRFEFERNMSFAGQFRQFNLHDERWNARLSCGRQDLFVSGRKSGEEIEADCQECSSQGKSHGFREFDD